MQNVETKTPNWRKGLMTKTEVKILGLRAQIIALEKVYSELAKSVIKTTEEVYESDSLKNTYIVVHYDNYGHQMIKYVNNLTGSSSKFERVRKMELIKILSNRNCRLVKGGLAIC